MYLPVWSLVLIILVIIYLLIALKMTSTAYEKLWHSRDKEGHTLKSKHMNKE